MTNLKKNVSTYNSDTLQYHGYIYNTNGRYSSIVANQRLTEAIVGAVEPSTRTILDMGSGDGICTAELKRAFPDIAITGIDPAQEAVRFAQKQYPNITFLVGNALEPSTLPHETYDIAIFRGMLHHTSDPESIIKNIAPLAKRLIIVEPNGNNIILKAIEKLSTYHREHEEQSFFPLTLMSWCRKAGYVVEKVDFAGFVPFFCPTPFAKFMHALQPTLEKIPVVRHLFAAVAVIRCRKP